MLVSDQDLRRLIELRRLRLEPYEPELLQPASIDLRLDRYFRVFANHRYTAIDPAIDQPELTEPVEVAAGEPFVLHPGEFVLGATLEQVTISDHYAGRVEGKSSLGRLGLLVHSTAGFIDPGFSGNITLELANVANLPIKLWPGMRIGQLCVFRLTSPSEHPYGHMIFGSRYQLQGRGPVPSRSSWNFRIWPTRPEESSCQSLAAAHRDE
jgi:dCTP deaminase